MSSVADCADADGGGEGGAHDWRPSASGLRKDLMDKDALHDTELTPCSWHEMGSKLTDLVSQVYSDAVIR